MVHNGIEYGLMAAYAEGLNILKHANVGSQTQVVDAETPHQPLAGAEISVVGTPRTMRSGRRGSSRH